MKQQGLEVEYKVGIFVAMGLGLVMLAILLLGGAKSFFSTYLRYNANFDSVSGLIPGAKVELGGLRVGVVERVSFLPQTRNIQVTLSIESEYQDWIRVDSRAEIATQGVLGDKYISIVPGTPEASRLPPGGELSTGDQAGISDMISSGGQLMTSLQSIAVSMKRLLDKFEEKNRSEQFFAGLAATATNLSHATNRINTQIQGAELKDAINHLNSILKKIDRGAGTLGALVNDPSLYDDAKSLVGGANRNRIMRNLVRKTIEDSEKQDAAAAKKK